MRNKDVFALTLACMFAAATTAQSQGLTQPWDEITPLTPQDRATIGSTVQSQIHGKPPGTTANWTSPASGHFGTIKLAEQIDTPGYALRTNRIPHLGAGRNTATWALCLHQLSVARRQLEIGPIMSSDSGR
jgi:hypothetical protein